MLSFSALTTDSMDEVISFSFFHLKLFIHEKNPSALNIKNLLTNLNLEIKFLKSLKSYIPNLLLFQGVVF